MSLHRSHNASRLVDVDGVGNLTSDGSTTYTYDYRGRLVSTTGAATATFGYDGDGIRSTITTPTTTTPLTWDRVGDLPEIISDGTTAYVHLPGQIISHDTATSIGLEDALGSIRYQTDPTGTTTHTLAYTPFGELASGSRLTRFGYTGEWTDPGGQLYLRARVYQPSTGRFLTRDPIQPNHPGTQGWNHYSYTTNNPTTLTDPAGLASLFENALIKSAIQGAVFGGASGLGAGLVACLSVRGVDRASCYVSAALIGGITGGIFGIPAGILAGTAAEVAFFAAVGGSWVRVGIAIAAACIGGAILGEQEDKFLSDILGVDPQPGISQIVGCVGGSAGFFGGGVVVIRVRGFAVP